jgi:histidinol-phosphate aminotransferase
MEHETLSRRRFGYFVSAAAAVAALQPSAVAADATDEPLRLHFNENPWGLSPAASRALAVGLEKLAWRYPGEERAALTDAIARHHRVDRACVLVTNGSAEALHAVAAAYLSPRRSLVVADPTYEALAEYAAALEAPVVRIPLSPGFEHDLEAMTAVRDGPSGDRGARRRSLRTLRDG